MYDGTISINYIYCISLSSLSNATYVDKKDKDATYSNTVNKCKVCVIFLIIQI